jgi:hypothetical protein
MIDMVRKAEWNTWRPAVGRYRLREDLFVDVIEIDDKNRTVRLQNVRTGHQFRISMALARDLLKHRVGLRSNPELREIARRRRQDEEDGTRFVGALVIGGAGILIGFLAGFLLFVVAGVGR